MRGLRPCATFPTASFEIYYALTLVCRCPSVNVESRLRASSFAEKVSVFQRAADRAEESLRAICVAVLISLVCASLLARAAVQCSERHGIIIELVYRHGVSYRKMGVFITKVGCPRVASATLRLF